MSCAPSPPHVWPPKPAGQTLQPTALVHEAYLRLVGPADAERWDHRGHFFAAAAEAMRRILVDAARRKRREKHGGGRNRVDLDCAELSAPDPCNDLVALDGALTRLAAEEAQAARLVELRYFAGLSVPEAAHAARRFSPDSGSALGVRGAWLHRELTGGAES